MLYVLLASLDKFHPDFFLVVYHNLGITIDDPRVRMIRGFRPPATGRTGRTGLGLGKVR